MSNVNFIISCLKWSVLSIGLHETCRIRRCKYTAQLVNVRSWSVVESRISFMCMSGLVERLGLGLLVDYFFSLLK